MLPDPDRESGPSGRIRWPGAALARIPLDPPSAVEQAESALPQITGAVDGHARDESGHVGVPAEHDLRGRPIGLRFETRFSYPGAVKVGITHLLQKLAIHIAPLTLF